jgi:hypothetical protein
MRNLILASTTLSTFAAVALAPARADACGGTFCDGAGPMPMSSPVDQTGETILFALEPDRVEAHIQIQYDPNTDAAVFAWIVPVFGTPEFEVGSQQLFVELLNATVPSYGYVQQFDFCGGDGDIGGGEFGSCSLSGGFVGGDEGGVDGSGGEDGGTTADGVDVTLQVTVGAFDITVVQAMSAMELMTWLGDNGYYQDPAAEPIFQQYVDEGAQFAAFGLTQGANVAEIHPIVIRYAGNEPCIPIRLTRIAAQDDMDIRAFFLGQSRVAPTNWRHVVLNEVQLDWVQFANNWKDVVTRAVDTPMADGHAWVTEYAGVSSVVPTDPLWSAAWQSEPFATIEPVMVVDELAAQGLLACMAGMCTFNHPLVAGLLQQWLPAPMGVPEQEFWSCLECYAAQIDMAAWDGAAFAQAVQDRIIVPGANAVDIVQGHPYLTRLYTTISPAEMTEDPLFWENPELEDVSLQQMIATQNNRCDGSQDYDLPDGFHVEAAINGTWPSVYPDDMPAALRVEEIPQSGAPIVLVDNRQVIEDLLAMWNPQYVGSGPAQGGSCSEDGGSFIDGDGSADGGGAEDGSKSGCGCTSEPRGIPIWAILPLFVATMRRRAS